MVVSALMTEISISSIQLAGRYAMKVLQESPSIFKKIWEDEDLAELNIQASDGPNIFPVNKSRDPQPRSPIVKKLFLSSSFSIVAKLLPEFYGDSLAGKTIAFIPTASNTEKVNFYVESGKKALIKLGATLNVLDISTAKKSDITKTIRDADLIYVSGGNTFFLLQEMKRTGADKLIKNAINSGTCYIGESAGSIIMSPNIEYVQTMDSIADAPKLRKFDGLNEIDLYPLPHHTNVPFKKNVEKIIAAYSNKIQLCPISNAQVIQVLGQDVSVVSK